MRISAFLETGLEKTRPDECLLIKAYETVSEGVISEHSTLLLESGTLDGDFQCPLLLAVVDGCNEFEGARLASEITAYQMSHFPMEDFLDCTLAVKGKKDSSKSKKTESEGRIRDSYGEGGSFARVSAALKTNQTLGQSLSDSVVVFKDRKETQTIKGALPPEEVVDTRKTYIRDYIKKMNEILILDGEQPWAKKGMASYLTGGIFLTNETYVYHIGGLKLMRKKGLSKYWESITSEQVDFSKTNPEDRVKACLGSMEDHSDQIMVEQAGELINPDKPAVLLNEGVYRYIEPAKLREFFESSEPAPMICRAMAEYARANGSMGDISIILLNFEEQTEEET